MLEKAPFKKKVAEKEILNRVYEDLEHITKISEGIRTNKQETVLGLLEIEVISKRYLDYCKERYVEFGNTEEIIAGLKKEVEIIRKLNEDLVEDKRKLRTELREYSVNINKLEASNIRLGLEKERLEELLDKTSEVNKENRRINEVLEMVERHYKVLATSRFMGTRSKENSPTFRDDVDTQEVVKDYLNKVPIKDIAKKHSMTPNAIRYRIKNEGAWRGRLDNK